MGSHSGGRKATALERETIELREVRLRLFKEPALQRIHRCLGGTDQVRSQDETAIQEGTASAGGGGLKRAFTGTFARRWSVVIEQFCKKRGEELAPDFRGDIDWRRREEPWDGGSCTERENAVRAELYGNKNTKLMMD